MRIGHFKERPAQWIALSDSGIVWSWALALIAALLIAPFVVGAYALTLMISALISVVGAVALNMLTGQTGLISLGQAGFLAVGAYVNAILIADYNSPLWLSLPAAGVGVGLISLLVGGRGLDSHGRIVLVIPLVSNIHFFITGKSQGQSWRSVEIAAASGGNGNGPGDWP
jgi:branched-chain amino acid transport system permease protein